MFRSTTSTVHIYGGGPRELTEIRFRRFGLEYGLSYLVKKSDAGAMQRSRGGNASITLSIPTRYIHTVNEMVNKDDVTAAATLLARYVEDSHNGDYAF